MCAQLFWFKRSIPEDLETYGYLEQNLLPAMAFIVTSKAPLLTAAQVNTQVEFDCTYRTFVKQTGIMANRSYNVAGLSDVVIYAKTVDSF